MAEKHSRLLVSAVGLLLVLIAGVVVLIWQNVSDRQALADQSPSAMENPATGESLNSDSPDDNGVERPARDPFTKDPNLPESLLDDLNRPELPPENDVRLLSMLFSDYRSVFKRMPLGMHQEMVATLQGDNKRGIEFIPKGHPAVSASNEIADRWGRPYFFHVISSSAVEIISAGPDNTLFTDDDIRNVPAHASVEPDLVKLVENLD